MIVLIASVSLFAMGGKDGASTMQLAASTGGMSASSPAGRSMAKFAELVNEYTNGSITVQVFYDTTLRNASSAISGIQQGTVDFLICGDSYYSGLAPEIQAFELPYMFEDLEEARAALNGPAADFVKKKLEASNIKALSFWEIGFRELTNNIRAVRTPSDLKGIKLRCLPATFQVNAWQSAGAMPVPMDVSELYSSLQQKVVDGQENPISEIYNQRFYEVQQYLSMTDHVYTPMLMSCSLSRWNEMTPEQQEAVQRAANDAQAECFNINDTDNQKLLDEIIASGVLVNDDVDKEAFKAAMASSHDMFIAQYGDEIISLM